MSICPECKGADYADPEEICGTCKGNHYIPGDDEFSGDIVVKTEGDDALPGVISELPNETQPVDNDPVNHPQHYTAHPSGVECIAITEHMGFCLGNAIKYIWRADLKHDAVEDLEKARWYLDREIERRKNAR